MRKPNVPESESQRARLIYEAVRRKLEKHVVFRCRLQSGTEIVARQFPDSPFPDSIAVISYRPLSDADLAEIDAYMREHYNCKRSGLDATFDAAGWLEPGAFLKQTVRYVPWDAQDPTARKRRSKSAGV